MRSVLLLLLLLLVGCMKPEAERMLPGRVLKDSDGCAFYAKAVWGGVSVDLTFSQELSAPTCNWSPAEQP